MREMKVSTFWEKELKLVFNKEPRVDPATNSFEASHDRREQVVEFFDSRRTIGFEYEWAMDGWWARKLGL
jgi:hypothetical protein